MKHWKDLPDTIDNLVRRIEYIGKPIIYTVAITVLGITYTIENYYRLDHHYNLVAQRSITEINGKKQVPLILSTVVFLVTTGTNNYTVPADWSDTNTVAVVGGGGQGGATRASGAKCSGGGGGAYAASTLTGISPGTLVSYSVGTASNDTWFLTSGTLLAQGGSNGNSSLGTAAQGGSASASIGTTKFSGGNSGAATGSGSATGGGGAAGQHGAGKNSLNATTVNSSTSGGAGDNGSGGSSGANGTNFDASHGSGGGGNGVEASSGNLTGGDGGLYGAGGGACAVNSAFGGSASSGQGAQGIIWIVYTPAIVGATRNFGFII